MSRDRISVLGAVVMEVPSAERVTSTLIPRICRLWAEIHEFDPDLALELARKLPDMKITRLDETEGR
jgi:hypothetical protein